MTEVTETDQQTHVRRVKELRGAFNGLLDRLETVDVVELPRQDLGKLGTDSAIAASCLVSYVTNLHNKATEKSKSDFIHAALRRLGLEPSWKLATDELTESVAKTKENADEESDNEVEAESPESSERELAVENV